MLKKLKRSWKCLANLRSQLGVLALALFFSTAGSADEKREYELETRGKADNVNVESLKIGEHECEDLKIFSLNALPVFSCSVVGSESKIEVSFSSGDTVEAIAILVVDENRGTLGPPRRIIADGSATTGPTTPLPGDSFQVLVTNRTGHKILVDGGTVASVKGENLYVDVAGRAGSLTVRIEGRADCIAQTFEVASDKTEAILSQFECSSVLIESVDPRLEFVEGGTCKRSNGSVFCDAPGDATSVILTAVGWVPVEVPIEGGRGVFDRGTLQAYAPFLANDERLSATGGDCGPITGKPLFKGYCYNYECRDSAATDMTLAFGDERFVAPSLASVGYPPESPLPDGLAIFIQSGGKKISDASYPLNAKTLELANFLGDREVKKYPASFDFTFLPAALDKSISFFSNENCSIALTEPIPYAPAFSDKVEVDQCSYFRVAVKDENQTACQPVEFDRTKDVFRVRPKPTSCGKDRSVIALAMSRGMGDRLSISVQESVTRLLASWRDDQSCNPVDIVTIDETSLVSLLFRREDIDAQTLDTDITSKIRSRATYSAPSQNPLRDLDSIDARYQGRLKKLVYIVDGSLQEAGSITGRDLGTPLSWSLSPGGPKLHILTKAKTEDCAAWTNRVMAATCDELAVGEDLEIQIRGLL